MNDVLMVLSSERRHAGMNNEQIQRAAEVAFNAHPGPRVGDFVKMPDGVYARFTAFWKWGLQTTPLAYRSSESFCMDASGEASYSGGLDPALPHEHLHLIEETRPGRFWHFDGGIPAAHSAVYYDIACRVYEYRPHV